MKLLENSAYPEAHPEQFNAVLVQVVQLVSQLSQVLVAVLPNVPVGQDATQVVPDRNEPELQDWHGDGFPVQVAQLLLQVVQTPELL